MSLDLADESARLVIAACRNSSFEIKVQFEKARFCVRLQHKFFPCRTFTASQETVFEVGTSPVSTLEPSFLTLTWPYLHHTENCRDNYTFFCYQNDHKNIFMKFYKVYFVQFLQKKLYNSVINVLIFWTEDKFCLLLSN